MELLVKEQLIKEYPWLEKISEYTLFITENSFNVLLKSIKTINKTMKISIEFLKEILNNDVFFGYVLKWFNEEINHFDVAYIVNGDIGKKLSYNRSEIITAFEILINSGEIILDNKSKERYEILKNSISFESLIERYKDKKYDIQIDGIDYSIPVIELISFMQLPISYLEDLCLSEEKNDINGIPKAHFVYAVINFFEEKSIFKNYLIPSVVKENYREIKYSRMIDLKAINQILTTKDSLYKKVSLNSELEEFILSGMPVDASVLEKAIYIYIKMCKTFTYDEEYYAVNQKGDITKKHRTVDYISLLSLDNNRIVCFEFNLIYSYFLNKLGINFESDYVNMVGENYGEGHANLAFRTSKYLVFADSVTSILKGDISRAKTNYPLVGLYCYNTNAQTKSEFANALTKMYQLVVMQENNAISIEVSKIDSFENLLSKYSHLTSNIKDVSLSERLSILIERVNFMKMKGIDSISYLLQLKRILFTSEQIENNIGIFVIRNNKPVDKNNSVMASVIIVTNDKGDISNVLDNKYFCFNPNQELISITRDELQTMFDDRIFDYVDKDSGIPGIEYKGEIKRC